MSTFFPQHCKCYICGGKNEYTVIGSTNAFGACDLDMRPPEMQRSTMPFWVQKCPDCGYVSDSVEDPSSVTREYLNSHAYKTCCGIAFRSNLAAVFYKQHLINSRDCDNRSAAFALLHAAWACDDEHDGKNAELCRLEMLPILTEVIEKALDDRDDLYLLKADVMRRASLFDQLIEQYSEASFSKVLYNQIAAFQIMLAEKRDSSVYTVADVPTKD